MSYQNEKCWSQRPFSPTPPTVFKKYFAIFVGKSWLKFPFLMPKICNKIFEKITLSPYLGDSLKFHPIWGDMLPKG